MRGSPSDHGLPNASAKVAAPKTRRNAKAACIVAILLLPVLIAAPLSSDSFMPHGTCYLWNPWLLSLQVGSDSLIALAYTTIPFTLFYFVRKRGDLPFDWMFVAFGIFIVACGATHLMNVWTVWHPAYWISGAVKLVTAVASIATAILLARLMPAALSLPSPSQFAKANEEIRRKNLALEEQNRIVQQADRLKSEFLANMSHELRTPLNAIVGFSEFLIDGKPGPLNTKQQEYLRDVLSSGHHLLSVINDILDLAKIESGKMEVNPEVFSVRQAIAEACAIVAQDAEKKNIALSSDISSNLNLVRLDRQKFRQILYNLLSNAVKFTGNDGTVKVIATSTSSDQLKIQVQDTGIGIRESDMGRLFTKFAQLDSGLARQYPGTGLGLALIKSFVDLQGGTITVESELGRGTTFTVVLPLVVGEEQFNSD